MEFYCNIYDPLSSESLIQYSSLNLGIINDPKHLNIIGVDLDSILGGCYFSILSDLKTNPNIKFIISSKSKLIDENHIYNTKIYDSIYKVYNKNIPFKIISIEEILKDILIKTFKNKYNLDYFIPRLIQSSRSFDIILEYSKYIESSLSNGIYKFISGKIPLNNLTFQNIKIYFKSYFAECLKIIQFTNTEEFERYIILQKFFRDMSTPTFTRTNVKYKSIANLMNEINTTNAYNNLKSFFQNDILTPDGNSLLDRFKSIQKICNTRTNIKLPNKIFNINIFGDRIKYEIYGSGFTIKTLPDIKIPTNLIHFINIIINFGKLDTIKNECEKIILLKC